VGVTMAMDLALRGIKSIVIEARDKLPPSPRCNTTNARTMEYLRRLGCADAVREAGLQKNHCTDVVYMTAMNAHEIHRFERPTTEQVVAGTAAGLTSDWPTPEPQHFISQLYMEPVLRKHAAERFNIDLRLGHELVSLTQDANGVSALIKNKTTGLESIITANYLVGADGSNSVVRRMIHARLEGTGRIGDTCTVFLRSKRLTEIYREHPGWMYRFLGGVILVAIDGKEEWLVHTHPPASIAIEDFNPEAMMFEAIGEAFEYETINLVRWTARAMVCNKFSEGRVFLVGDAAHIWIPMGGFGMNAGIGDGISLSWRLAGVIQGWLDSKILTTYELERMPLGATVASQAMRWGADNRSLLQHHPIDIEKLKSNDHARQALSEKIARVNISEWRSVGIQLGYAYTNSPIIDSSTGAPPPFTIEEYKETSAPGARAPHLWLSDNESSNKVGPKRKALFDEFGIGLTLLCIGVGVPQTQEFVEASKARHIPLKIVYLPQAEAIKKYENWSLVLVRPDQHICWRGNAIPTDIDKLLDQITGALLPLPFHQQLSASLIRDDLPSASFVVQRRDRLLYSDTNSACTRWLNPNNAREGLVFPVSKVPGAMVFLPSGCLLIASLQDSRINFADSGILSCYADLSGLVNGTISAMTVDRFGAVYVSDDEAIIRIGPDRKAKVVLKGLNKPNCLAITPDGNTMLIHEMDKSPTSNKRASTIEILQSRFSLNGDMNPVRPYFELGEDAHCNAMHLGKNGDLWLSLPKLQQVRCYSNATRLKATIDLPFGIPNACTLSDDEKTIYIAGTFEHTQLGEATNWLAKTTWDNK
jgi:2-polyprenyl-6-methoxyphenol hydroxylase-like FAD-dependent oxidoreductase/sugar lactone lactonase YvrE